MKFLHPLSTLLAASSLLPTTIASPVPFERLDKNDSMLLILDLQDGLYSLARDFDATLYYNSMIAHSALGQLFDIPVVMTTSAQQGPNGPLPREILEMWVSHFSSSFRTLFRRRRPWIDQHSHP